MCPLTPICARKRALVAAVFMILAFSALPAAAGWDEGVAAFKSGNYSLATTHFEALAQRAPQEWRTQYMLGLTAARLAKKAEAVRHLRKAYDLNPSDLALKKDFERASAAPARELPDLELGDALRGALDRPQRPRR